MSTLTLIWLVVGVLGTWLGAELLVRGSVRIALALGIRPLVVGLTVVALGTSSPEAVVSLVAAAKGSGGIAVGNVFGSNIANIGLILGFIGLMHPVRVAWREIRLDTFFMVGATLIASAFAFADMLNPISGAVLLGLLVAALVYYIRGNHAPGGENPLDGEALAEQVARPSLVVPVMLSVAGLGLLVAGAQLLVESAEEIARHYGVPEEVIGATMIAVGTSLPELAASVVAIVRGHHDLGVGNIVGSNQMNLLFVLGGVSMFGDVAVADSIRTSLIPIMLAFTFVLVPMMATGGRIRRVEAGLLLAGYAVFAATSYF